MKGTVVEAIHFSRKRRRETTTNDTPLDPLARLFLSVHNRAETFWWQVDGDSVDGLTYLFGIQNEENAIS